MAVARSGAAQGHCSAVTIALWPAKLWLRSRQRQSGVSRSSRVLIDYSNTRPDDALLDQRFRALVAIIAPPRSGTTIVTAALSVHSDVLAIFEPWNANARRVDSAASMTFDEFVATFVPPRKPGSVLVVKETATYLHYVDRVDELLDTAPARLTRRLVMILRNPFHVFLSEVQARREWWGAEDLAIDAETFSRWAQRMLHSCRRLADLAVKHDGLLLSYDAFSRFPEGVNALTRMIGLEHEPAQDAFEQHLDRSAVRGDLRVSTAPQPISSRSIDHRDEELAGTIDLFAHADEYAAIERLAQAFASLPSLSRAREQRAVTQAMQPD